MVNHKLQISQFKKLLSGQFIRNVGWLGAGELFNRLFRLATTVTLARMFSPYDYGLMAVIYTTFDFALALTLKHGVGAKIIQADAQRVDYLCDTAYWLNWLVCGSIFILQCLAAFPIAQFYDDPQLVFPLCVASSMYLMFPIFLVQSALVERENRLKVTAMCNAIQSFISNTITVVLALLGMGVWSIVWAMVISTPTWIVINWHYSSWRPPKSFTLKGWEDIFHFGKNFLGVELLTKLRLNLDYLIVGKILGVDALGIYYFAFNAGSGITMNVVSTFMSALFPHLCRARHQQQELKKQYLKSIKTIALAVVPLVLMQSFLAPIYVPIIFGNKWASAIPILVLICLSVIPRTFKWTASSLINAVDKSHLNLTFDVIYTFVFALSIIFAVQAGILWVAATVLLVQIVMSFGFNLWSFQKVFASSKA